MTWCECQVVIRITAQGKHALNYTKGKSSDIKINKQKQLVFLN